MDHVLKQPPAQTASDWNISHHRAHRRRGVRPSVPSVVMRNPISDSARSADPKRRPASTFCLAASSQASKMAGARSLRQIPRLSGPD